MLDEIELGSSPPDEPCAQLGDDGYEELATRECAAYVRLLQRAYAAAHDGQQPTCRLRVKRMPHDFGSYYEVVASYRSDDEEAVNAAFWLEGNGPQQWDEVARTELAV